MTETPVYLILVTQGGVTILAPYYQHVTMLVDYSRAKKDGLTPRVFRLSRGLPDYWREMSAEDLDQVRANLA